MTLQKKHNNETVHIRKAVQIYLENVSRYDLYFTSSQVVSCFNDLSTILHQVTCEQMQTTQARIHGFVKSDECESGL